MNLPGIVTLDFGIASARKDLPGILDYCRVRNDREILPEYVRSPAQLLLRIVGCLAGMIKHLYGLKYEALGKHWPPRLHDQAFLETMSITTQQRGTRPCPSQTLIVTKAPPEHRLMLAIELSGKQ